MDPTQARGATIADLQRATEIAKYEHLVERLGNQVPACSSCRKSKVKCDRLLPCTQCARRGQSELCSIGCQPCRKAKMICPGGLPTCKACVESKATCAPVEDREEPPLPPLEPDKRRVWAACQGCRKDNRKCESQRPCARCTAKGRDCIEAQRMKRSTGLKCVRCRRKKLKCDHERPCKACTTDKRKCVAAQRRRSAPESRSKKACEDCKRDKARCDSDFPCGRCIIKDRRCSNGEWPMEGSHDPLYKETPGVAYKWTHQGDPLEGYPDPRTG